VPFLANPRTEAEESLHARVRDRERSPSRPVASKQFNRASLDLVETDELKLTVKLQPEVTGGILEWKVKWDAHPIRAWPLMQRGMAHKGWS
jgi:hypothetical protein